MFTHASFWLCVIAAVMASALPDLIYETLMNTFETIIINRKFERKSNKVEQAP